MQGNNAIMIVGRVGRDPEVRHLDNGRAVAKFTVAVNRIKRDDPPDWFQVSLWGKPAELAGELIRKGALVSVAGSCHVDEWTDKQGAKQRMVKIAADNFQLLGSKAEGTGGGNGEAAADELERARKAGQAAQSDDYLGDDEIPPF